MNRFAPGDLVIPGPTIADDESVAIFDVKPITTEGKTIKVPKDWTTNAKVVGGIAKKQLAMIIAVIDRDHVVVSTGTSIGISIAGWFQLAPGVDDTI